MRRLLLMRHARPEPASAGRDSARELAPEGWSQARRVAGQLRLLPAIDRVLSSPAVRCVQTAKAVLEADGRSDATVEIHEVLGGEDGAACVSLAAPGAGVTLIVSHHPTLLGLGAVLLGSSSRAVDLRPGQVAVLEHAEEEWRLATILDPGESR